MPAQVFSHVPCRVLLRYAVLATLGLAVGCASSRSDKEADPSIDEADAFTPIRAKYSAVTPADLGHVDQLLIAVVDADFSEGVARLAFFPAQYQPRNGLCQIVGERRPCSSVAELVAAIDRRVDRMPFGILFTYRMRPASQGAVNLALPPAYSAFVRDFQSAMRAEGIEFVTLLPDEIVLLN